MRSMLVAVAFLQAAFYPPAYPRPGAIKLLENDRVIVWDITWLKQQYAMHRHPYDLAGVYYTAGDRLITSTDGTKRPVSTKAWDTAFQRKGITHIEEGTSDAPLHAVFFEMKEDSASGQNSEENTPTAFPGAGVQAFLDNDRVIAWDLTNAASLPSPHRHARDAVIIWFSGQTPHAAFIKRGTVHGDEGPGVVRAYVYELK